MSLVSYLIAICLALLVIVYHRPGYEIQNEELSALLNPYSGSALVQLAKSYLPLKNDEITAKHGYNPAKADQPKLSSNSYFEVVDTHKNRAQIGIENATMVMLVRNIELKGALLSMRSLEDRFNHQYKYPWVFLNDVPFDQDFIDQTTLMASGKTYYELIPTEDWDPPAHIDLDKLEDNIAKSTEIIYGFSKSYRNMCHFNSGYFYKQKRLLDYEWYFRVEPDVHYMCDFQYDPFTLMRTRNKLYGFVIAIPEYENTIPTLWDTVKGFMDEFPQHLHPNNSLDFITTNDSDVFAHTTNSEYNLCHFWSNFEIGNLDFFRGEAYEAYFHHLDMAGGFYYERWGDAPVHTIGVSLLMDRDAVHHFEDIGYYHLPYMSCPTSYDVLSAKRCICLAVDPAGKPVTLGLDIKPPSCLPRWWRYGGGKRFLNEIEYTFW